jgi:hypothetical protein
MRETEEIETLLRIIGFGVMIIAAIVTASFIIGIIYLPSL